MDAATCSQMVSGVLDVMHDLGYVVLTKTMATSLRAALADEGA